MYYGRPGGAAALDRFYRPFVPTGGLCFDIGAHVGNRTRCWSRLGARVVAVEPQGDFARFLRWLFRADPRVTILRAGGRRTSRDHPDAGQPADAYGQ